MIMPERLISESAAACAECRLARTGMLGTRELGLKRVTCLLSLILPRNLPSTRICEGMY